MTDHQARARELLAIVEDARLHFYALGDKTAYDLATELRAALDENLALRAEVERLQPGFRVLANAEPCTFTDCYSSDFTGRRTARNRPDIPSDAGYGEGWSVGEAMRNDPYDDDNVSRAIGQPGTKA